MLESIHHFIRRLSPADKYYRRGVPRPIGPQGMRIWTARTLDWTVLGYLITVGKLAQPVAFVFGSMNDPVTCTTDADYRKARQIACTCAVVETRFVFDLREFDWEHPGRLEFILDLVLYPTDRKGRGVFESSGELYGGMLDYSGGLRFAVYEGAHEERGSHRGQVPTFEAALAGGGWCLVPPDLKQHLDRVDPRPDKKSRLSAKPLTLLPASEKSLGAEPLTAA